MARPKYAIDTSFPIVQMNLVRVGIGRRGRITAFAVQTCPLVVPRDGEALILLSISTATHAILPMQFHSFRIPLLVQCFSAWNRGSALLCKHVATNKFLRLKTAFFASFSKKFPKSFGEKFKLQQFVHSITSQSYKYVLSYNGPFSMSYVALTLTWPSSVSEKEISDKK